MKFEFYKYQGTGNDFVIIDNRASIKKDNARFDKKNLDYITRICDRRYGVGGDGLILIEDHPDLDFEMIYYNSDGSQSFCGNGSRCAVSFAKSLGLINGNKTNFLSTDGPHIAEILGNEHIRLKMNDVSDVEEATDHCYLNTGSPHYVMFVEDVDKVDVEELGSAVRNNQRFKKAGTNVNFVEMTSSYIKIRTYERGVEGETLSCGTGVTASALCASRKESKLRDHIRVKTPGGMLGVSFKTDNQGFNEIWLEGPAKLVFKGVVEL